ncbi:20210_t:CDS:2, partial [Cetraspora pellucida]
MSYNSLQVTSDYYGQQSDPLRLDNLLDLFKKCKIKYGFNATYLMSLLGEAVKKDNAKKWIEKYFKQDFKTLQIISQDKLVPLYEIFEKSIRCEIESILGIKNENKILMTGITQIIKNTRYYHISFPDRLNSSNYLIFAKIVRINGKQNYAIDTVFVKIQSATKTGFLAIVENLGKIEKVDPVELQIMWILIGLPNEIDFFSIHTRKLSVLRVEHREIEPNERSISLDIPENCSKTLIMALSFEFLLNRDKVTNQGKKIKLNIENKVCSEELLPESSEFGGGDDDLSDTSEESQGYDIKHSLYSCIFVPEDDFIEADISNNRTKYINMKAM